MLKYLCIKIVPSQYMQDPSIQLQPDIIASDRFWHEPALHDAILTALKQSLVTS
jgi:hypothetical protein